MADRSAQDDPTARAVAAAAQVETAAPAPAGVPDDESGTDSAAAEEASGGHDGPTDAKAAFAAVLARKQQAAQTRTAHLDGHGSVGGATANHKATRTFRRKSG